MPPLRILLLLLWYPLALLSIGLGYIGLGVLMVMTPVVGFFGLMLWGILRGNPKGTTGRMSGSTYNEHDSRG